MRIPAVVAALVVVACAGPQLEWPDINPNFARLDAGRKLIYERIDAARDLGPTDEARAELLEAVGKLHERSMSEFATSKLHRVAQIDQTNALVTFQVHRQSPARPHLSEDSLFVYPLVKVGGQWKIVKSYQLIQSQAVE